MCVRKDGNNNDDIGKNHMNNKNIPHQTEHITDDNAGQSAVYNLFHFERVLRVLNRSNFYPLFPSFDCVFVSTT